MEGGKRVNVQTLVPIVFWAGATAIAQVVPTPAATPAEVVVSGRTSTLKAIAIENVGQNIPATFSNDRLKNAEGFNWFVSQHYALQTDYDAGRAKHYLTLLELAYPHYVELFGREIAGIDQKRMAVIYGSSTDSLKAVLAADGISWDFGGGGITYEGINAAFNYPSGSLQYHQRYIILHECAHLYQDCLNGTTMTTPYWYYEGVADSISSHVWEESRQRLTMEVLDKAAISNWYDEGLLVLARQPFKASDILSGRRGERSVNFLLVNYFRTDMHRMVRWRIWQDELFRLNLYHGHQGDSDRLIEELFGSAQLDIDFDKWLKDRRSSFHYVDWGWEQDGDSLISYGWPQTGAFSQTDLKYVPGEALRDGPLVLDYPHQPQSALVGKCEFGVKEPVVGCLVSFKANPERGVAGMGLGVEGRSFVRVMVEECKRLVADGTEVGAGRVAVEFSEEFRNGMARSQEVGLTLTLGGEELVIVARTEGEALECRLSLPLTAVVRDRLMSRPMAALSRDGRHTITPYIGQKPATEDYSRIAPANRWRFTMMPELYSLERAIWRLQKQAPDSLVALRDKLLAAANQDSDGQAATRSGYLTGLATVVADIVKSAATAETRDAAIGELRGK